jgi:glycosyltransferase involved in cell wall biosynthesis
LRIGMNLEQLLYRVPGGTGRYTARLAEALSRLEPGDEIVPFSAWHRPGDIDRALQSFDMSKRASDTARFPLPRPALYEGWNRFGLPPVQLLSRLRRLDVVHAPYVAVPGTGRTPLVVSLHDAGYVLFPESYTPRGRSFHQTGVKRAAAKADLVLTGTAAAADEIAANTPITRDRISVTPYGVETTPVDAAAVGAVRKKFDLDRPYALWVGTLEPRKNVGTLVAAFAEAVGEARLEHDLVLVGPTGWLTSGLIDADHKRRLGRRLRVVGHVTDLELGCLYSGADVFALPSLHEGFGLPALEAMAYGTPVICSDIPALREVTGGAARLVDPTSRPGWAAALIDVLGDADRRAAMISAGAARRATFTWDNTAAATRRAYLSVTASL